MLFFLINWMRRYDPGAYLLHSKHSVHEIRLKLVQNKPFFLNMRLSVPTISLCKSSLVGRIIANADITKGRKISST